MKKNYVTVKRLSVWMQLSKKWNNLISTIDERTNITSLKKINKLSLRLGVNRKVVLASLAGVVSFGANAQLLFDEVTDRTEQIIPTPIPVGERTIPAFTDLDGDGDLDLILGDYDGNLNYFTNENNFFTLESDANNPFSDIEVYDESVPAFADIDDDGDQDLIIGDLYGDLEYFSNNGNVFTQQLDDDNPFNGVGVGEGAAITFIDLDKDNDLDLVSGNADGMIKYFLNEEGTYTEQLEGANPFSNIDVGEGASPAFIDMDDDGDQDLVVGEYYGTLLYYVNADNVFTRQNGVDNPFNDISVDTYAVPRFADLDKDGDLDLALGSFYSFIGYYTNNGGDFVETENPFGNYFESLPKQAFVDLDKDGDLDLLVASIPYSLDNYLMNYYENIENVFIKQSEDNNPFSSISSDEELELAFTDIDDDGDQDLIVSRNESIDLYINTGNDFTLAESVDNPFSDIAIVDYIVPTFTDLDDDGDQDLILSTYSELQYYVNNDNSFDLQADNNPFESIILDDIADPVFADLDKDGDMDLVLANYDGTVNYYENKEGVFAIADELANPFSDIALGYFASPAFADLDKDGDLDLFLADFYGSFIEYKNSSIIAGVGSKADVEQLSIYPNPATSIINTEKGQLDILDALGNQVLSTESNGKVDISGLESGVYLVSQNGKRTKLVVK